MTLASWKDTLGDRIPVDLAEEIDVFETQLELKRQDKIDEKVFAETRLRRGVYGQRYDNGRRHDGLSSRELDYPSGDLTKGPTTVWDAPGMMRIKIPFGAVDATQMRALADLAALARSRVIAGVIVGRALYDGAFELRAALDEVESC